MFSLLILLEKAIFAPPPPAQMPEGPQWTDRDMRLSILYEVQAGCKFMETRKKMMRTFGQDFMEINEFEQWFLWFKDGNDDLDVDARPVKPREKFRDNKFKALQIAVGRMGLKEQIHFRRASHSTGQILDSIRTAFKSIDITIGATCLLLKFNDEKLVIYCANRKEGESVVVSKNKKSSIIIEDEQFLAVAMREIKFALENRNNEFESFRIGCHQQSKQFNKKELDEMIDSFYELFLPLFFNFFQEVPAKIDELSIQVNDLGSFGSILKICDKPSKIEICNVEFPITYIPHKPIGEIWEEDREKPLAEKRGLTGSERDYLGQEVIVNLNSFKNGKECVWIHRPFRYPLNAFFHFERFEVFPEKLTTADLLELKNAVFEGMMPNFKIGRFIHPKILEIDDCVTSLELYQRFPEEPVPDSWSCDIPDRGGDRLVFMIGTISVFVQIQRKGYKPQEKERKQKNVKRRKMPIVLV